MGSFRTLRCWSHQMWAEKEIGNSMTSGLEQIAHAIPYEVKKDLSQTNHKQDGLVSPLVFDWLRVPVVHRSRVP